MSDKMPPLPEHIAEVMSAWSLAWAGTETLAKLLESHPSVRIGSKLYSASDMHAYARAYAAQRVAPLVKALRDVGDELDGVCGYYPLDDRRLDAVSNTIIAALAAEKEHSNG